MVGDSRVNGSCGGEEIKHVLVLPMDKNFGKIGRKIAEISFFGGPRKEKRMENSSARKIDRKSGVSNTRWKAR